MRLFVAVALPEAVRDAVTAAVTPLRALGADVRWTDPAGWHLTVAFLGQTDPGLVDPLREGLVKAAAAFTPFEVQLRPAAGRGGRSAVLWVEVEPSVPFALVAEAVGDALRELGLRTEDRAFRPHLTLARARARGAVPRSLADAYQCPPIAWTVLGLELVRSYLGRMGARYETVATLPFCSAEPDVPA